MSLYPYVFDEMLHELSRPTIFDQHFGIGIPSSELAICPMRTAYMRPYQHHIYPRNSGVSNIVLDKDGFKVNLDVQQFKPEELNVKVVDDCVVVEGKHEERYDEHGFISREFTRRYKLPEDTDVKALESKLSSDGVLQLHAPKLASSNATEHSIPITHTNQPALQQNAQLPQIQAKETGDKTEKPEKLEKLEKK